MIKLSLNWRACLLLLWSFHFITVISYGYKQMPLPTGMKPSLVRCHKVLCENQRLGERHIVQTRAGGRGSGSSQSWLGIRKWMQSSTVSLGWQTQHPSLISLLFQVWTANMPVVQQAMTQFLNDDMRDDIKKRTWDSLQWKSEGREQNKHCTNKTGETVVTMNNWLW